MKPTSKAARLWTGSLFFYLFLTGCASTPQSDAILASIPDNLKQPVELTSVPFYPQHKYQCGPAALATLLGDQGREVDMDELVRRVYIPGRQGSLQLELIAASRDYGLIPYTLVDELPLVLNEIRAGRPVLVLQNLGVSWYPQWHYAVVVGYDLAAGELILRSGTTERYRINLYTFEHTWQRGKRWAMILLKPGQLPTAGDDLRYMNAIVGFERSKNWSLLDKAYQAGLGRWPGSSVLRMGYGNSLYSQGKLTAALEQYQKVIALDAGYAPAYNNAGQVCAELGRFDQALQYVKRAIELGGVHSKQYRSTLKDIYRMQSASH